MQEQVSLKVGVQGGQDILKVANSINLVERNIMKLSTSMQKGNISVQLMNKGIQKQIVELKKLGVSHKEATKAVYDFYNAQKAMTGASMAATKANNRMGVVMQQAGYQIGDFAVQVQSGQNILVAFSQQATQLVGILPLVATQLGITSRAAIALSAGLGIAIPIVSMLAMTWWNTKNAMKDTEPQFKKLTDILKDVKDKAREATTALEMLQSGANSEEELAATKRLDKLKQELADYKSILAQVQKAALVGFGAAGGIMTSEELQKLVEQGAEAKQNQLQDDIRALETQIEYLQNAEMLLAEEEAIAEVKKKQAEKEEELYQLKIESQKASHEMLAEAIKTYRENQKVGRETLRLLEQELIVSRKKLMYGEDNISAQLSERKHIIDNLRLQLQRDGVEKDLIDKIIKQKEELLLNESIMEANKKEAQGLADALAKAASALDSLKSFGNTLKTSLAQAKAEAFALANGLDVGVAKSIAGQREQNRQRLQIAFGAATDEAGRKEAFTVFNQQRELINQLEKITTENAAETERQRNAERSGSKSAKDQSKFDEYINQLQRELKLKVDTAFKTDEQIKREEFMAKIREKGIDLGTEATQKQMASVMQLYEKTVELQKITELMDVFEQNLENAFMAVVDGSKSVEDAFKGLIRTMLMEIFKQQVAQPWASGIAGWVGKLVGSADGNVFSGGRVTAFANGGVVGGPTMFPMANGVGLMGEAGPEAIMPLKRGRDGKLGIEGGGGITVVQNINISTGVQQTVRNEIRQMMPMIAESAKSAVADSKRRGGNYGRQFA